ncbi:non-hydrolyzing UDP-N-acetylglucosamine 2-epimerase [Sphingomonas sp.]|uniref:non-hydrolyzing UDP-N-acetylglucosamine 2-epimerase n=1 Tax=Sphingomonas sp. TaxID=28214 RepID=UPI001DC40698|nr:UDP-N-acetylglucosamine 2-epimerase (non-hydrolyzing) [Sphingomonas sp.]MBX9795993.1 UDP-N-acetylglucosamine 2-epimerase (non-hydrolyzing) [Sphingomonas sp.]
MTRKIVTIVGARPQFIKAGAVSRAIAQDGGLDEVLVHTGQHFDDAMSDIFFRELELPHPKHNLGIAGQTHGAMTGRMMEAIEKVLIEETPDLCLVYGDTNSTIAGSLAAAKLHIPVGHVEAGLRSFNRRMPEELNRVVTDHLAAIQFCPTRASIDNLRAEGIVQHVYHTGDVMFDATRFAIAATAGRDGVLQQLGLTRGNYNVCTIHRAENTDDPVQLAKVADYLRAVAAERPLVLPLHPRTRGALARNGLNFDFAVLTEPLGYFDLNALLAGAVAIYTDSGGLQKEAYFHGKPCVTLRDETEWVETIDHGWNRLWQGPDYVTPRQPIADYGAGDAAEKIVTLLRDFLG